MQDHTAAPNRCTNMEQDHQQCSNSRCLRRHHQCKDSRTCSCQPQAHAYAQGAQAVCLLEGTTLHTELPLTLRGTYTDMALHTTQECVRNEHTAPRCIHECRSNRVFTPRRVTHHECSQMQRYHPPDTTQSKNTTDMPRRRFPRRIVILEVIVIPTGPTDWG